MNRKHFVSFSLGILSLFASLVSFADNATALFPAPPPVNAAAYVLMDANSGKILAQNNMDTRRPPASLTKLMTLYIISSNLKNGTIHSTDMVPISEKAWRMGGSKMFVKVGTSVAVEDLLKGIIVDSGNDACVAMAQYIGGSEQTFADMMNAQAQTLGMTNTHYMDSTGLPNPNHYSTAHDLAILASNLVLNFPEDYQWYKQTWFTYNKIRQPNRNRLLWHYPGADGIKTGHTEEAGFCLIGSAERNNMRLISVVLGAPSDSARTQDSIQLLDYGFNFFRSYQVYKANTPIAEPRVWYGKSRTVPVGMMHDFYITAPRGPLTSIQINVDIPKNIQAPITKGQPMGTITATMNGTVVANQSLFALSDDPKAGSFRKAWDTVAKLIPRNPSFEKTINIDQAVNSGS